MCQMCDEYEAELLRMGIAVDPEELEKRHGPPETPSAPEAERQPVPPAAKND